VRQLIITKSLQKYALLSLSLDVISDVSYFHGVAVKSAMSKLSKFAIGQLKRQSGVELMFPSMYQNKKTFSNEVLRLGRLRHLIG